MQSRHYETSRFIPATAERVFEHLDDHARLAAHMSKSSWKMGGGRMEMVFDDKRGRVVGSRILLAGRVFGISLFVEEIVTERDPPYRKIWETLGTPKLLVIGQYRLGFEIRQQDGGTMLRVFIDYALPQKGWARWCGVLAGNYYAKWCTQQMLHDAEKHFRSQTLAGSRGATDAAP